VCGISTRARRIRARRNHCLQDGPRGSESGWGAYFVGQPQPARLEFWRYWVFGDPEWSASTFDFDSDVAFADAKLAAVSAIDPNLGAFRARQGKLLLYHGWADAVSPPEEDDPLLRRGAASIGRRAADRGLLRVSLWRRAWDTARADPVLTSSTRSVPWTNGYRKAWRRRR